MNQQEIYYHGDATLQGAIAAMTQEYIGSNNLAQGQSDSDQQAIVQQAIVKVNDVKYELYGTI